MSAAAVVRLQAAPMALQSSPVAMLAAVCMRRLQVAAAAAAAVA